ncbi:MAG: hypothetical protein ACI85U_003441 [Candidatus Promineifilaceae bacterium]|jgi:hypothetical protein
MAWANHADNGNWNNIVSTKTGDGVLSGWTLLLNDDNTAALTLANGSNQWTTSSAVVPANEWHH